MDNQRMIDFVLLVVKTIQTNYNSTKEAKAAMERLLNEADDLAVELHGENIVLREPATVLERLTSTNPLKRIKQNEQKSR